MLLSQVIAQVEQLDAHVLEPLNQLEITHPHRAAGTAALVAVMGVVPEERALGLGTAFEQRDNAHAVRMLLRAWRQAGARREVLLAQLDALEAAQRRGLRDGRPELSWEPVRITKWQPQSRSY